MTKYDVVETTIVGERRRTCNGVEYDSFDGAVAKYFLQHSDPKSVHGLDIWKLPDGIYTSYGLGYLAKMGMPVTIRFGSN